jgi:hypothetical protein
MFREGFWLKVIECLSDVQFYMGRADHTVTLSFPSLLLSGRQRDWRQGFSLSISAKSPNALIDPNSHSGRFTGDRESWDSDSVFGRITDHRSVWQEHGL